jgi:hypothetical protein
MRGKTLSHETARTAVEARRQGKPYKLLDSALGEVGADSRWDESRADRAADRLVSLKDKLAGDKLRLDVNTFDPAACIILHEELELPPNLVAADGFWRWLAVEKFSDIVEARSSSEPAHLRNYGIDASVTDNRIAILWFRAHMVYDRDSLDSYHLARRPAHTDFWESGIIRHRYAWSPTLARALVAFQYRDPSSDKAYLHSTHANGIRELYKRLRKLHTTVSFEFLSDEEIWAVLEEKSSELQPA